MTQTDTSAVLYDVRDGVALVTLNRPERLNAWSADLEDRYADALDRATADPDVRVVVVTGAGRGFCAGADMSLLQDLSGGTGEARHSKPHYEFAPAVPKPVIAAINGACAGLGLVHALLCDIRFAAEGAKFTSAFARRGLIAEHGVAWLLPRVVGLSRSMDILLSGRVFVAEEAAQMGLVDRVFPADRLLEETLAYARDMATWCSPASMREMKAQLWQQAWGSIEENVADANRRMVASFGRPDFKEGVDSYVEKREPRFSGVTGSE